MLRHILRIPLLLLVLAVAVTASAASAAQIPASAPHLAYVEQYLQSHVPGTEGKVWWFSRGNDLHLSPDWLLQTPNCWRPRPGTGEVPCTQPPPGGEAFVQAMKLQIASAEKSVDILNLVQFSISISNLLQASQGPEGQFLGAIVAGLKEAKARGHEPIVRLLIGNYPPSIYEPRLFADALRRNVGSWVKVQSGYMRSAQSSL